MMLEFDWAGTILGSNSFPQSKNRVDSVEVRCEHRRGIKEHDCQPPQMSECTRMGIHTICSGIFTCRYIYIYIMYMVPGTWYALCLHIIFYFFNRSWIKHEKFSIISMIRNHDKMITCINFDFVQQLLNTFIGYFDSIHVSLASSERNENVALIFIAKYW